MKKLILSASVILFIGLTAFAQDGTKDKKCEKKCEPKECSTIKSGAKCEPKDCTTDKACKGNVGKTGNQKCCTGAAKKDEKKDTGN